MVRHRKASVLFEYTSEVMQSGSRNNLIDGFSLKLLVTFLIVGLWLALRPTYVEISNPISVLCEWIGLFAVTAVVVVLPDASIRYLRVAVALAVAALVFAATWSTEVMPQFPQYWAGFGPRVAVLSGLIAIAVLAGRVLSYRAPLVVRRRLSGISSTPQRILAIGAIAWTLPTIVQPMDGLLNVGDSTEKVLDEIGGWVVGNYPGIDLAWVCGAMLGVPLAPLRLVEGHGDLKLVVVNLYTNLLVVAVPLSMAGVVRHCFPKIGRMSAFALMLVAVSVSGQPGNSAVFQELSFLARGLLPVVLGLATIKFFEHSQRVPNHNGLLLFGLGVLSGITLLNNYEYGVGAASAAAVSTLIVPSASFSRGFALRRWVAGFGSVTLLFGFLGIFRGGNWLVRRLGAWSDVVVGGGAQHSNNAGSQIPSLGLPTIYFALMCVGAAIAVRELRREDWGASSSATVSLVYFSVWSLLAAPYFLNGGGAGAFRTQFLMIPVVLIAASVLGLFASGGTVRDMYAHQSRSMQSDREGRVAGTVRLLPLFLLPAVLVAAVVQVPNGVVEWRRIQTPDALNRHLDEWSPERLDWIDPQRVRQLAEPYGGVEAVGWWFAYGNAIEMLTGIENLLGVTGWETMRSAILGREACSPLLSSDKRFVISIETAPSRIDQCRGLELRPLTTPNEDGLVVYGIERRT
jgi:hypothetical protein